MTPREIQQQYGPLINWLLGGLCVALLGVCSLFLNNLLHEFKSAKAELRVFGVNQAINTSRIDQHSERLHKLEDFQKDILQNYDLQKK